MLEQLGYTTERSHGTRYGRVDFFNLYDIMAVSTQSKMKFIQVKSNGTGGKLNYTGEKSAAIMSPQHYDVEYWTCYDRKGWKIYRLNWTDADEWGWEIIIDERDKDCNMGDLVLSDYE